MQTEWLENNLTLFIAHTLSLLLDERCSNSAHQDGLHAVKNVVSIFTQTLDQLLSEKAQLQVRKFPEKAIFLNTKKLELHPILRLDRLNRTFCFSPVIKWRYLK